MPPAHTEHSPPAPAAQAASRSARSVARACTASARCIGLVLLCIAGTLLNRDFATLGQRA